MGIKGKYKKFSDDVESVAYWYQTDPHAPFPPLPAVKDPMASVLLDPQDNQPPAPAASFRPDKAKGT